MFVVINDGSGVGSLVGVDSNDEHECPPRSEVNAATGTPDAGMPFLFRATPQHGNRQTASSLGSQPAGGRAFSRPPPAPSTLRINPKRVHPILYQGNMRYIVGP